MRGAGGRGTLDVSERSLGDPGMLPGRLRCPRAPANCPFYGANFLKDVRTTKLNEQLDVKGRLLLNICGRGVHPIFLLFVVSLAASSTGRRVECEIESLVRLPSSAVERCFNYLSADFDELREIQGSSSLDVSMTRIRIERFSDMLTSSLMYEQINSG